MPKATVNLRENLSNVPDDDREDLEEPVRSDNPLRTYFGEISRVLPLTRLRMRFGFQRGSRPEQAGPRRAG